MSILSGLFKYEGTDDTGALFSIEDIYFNVSAKTVQFKYDIIEFDKYINACSNLQSVFASIESHNGRLEEDVREFVDCNHELSDALGIALESNQPEANGAKVESKKPGFFKSIWDAIVKFFKAIWNGITGFFAWVFNGFKRIQKPLDITKDSYLNLTDEKRKAFLESTKTTIDTETILKRITTTKLLLEFLMVRFKGGFKGLLTQYFRDPHDIFTKEIAGNLANIYGITIKSGNTPLEVALAAKTTDYIEMDFTLNKEDVSSKNEGTLASKGWNNETIENYFTACYLLSKEASNMEDSWRNIIDSQHNVVTSSATDKEAEIKKIIEEIGNGFFLTFLKKHFWGNNVNNENRDELAAKGESYYMKGVSNVAKICESIVVAVRMTVADLTTLLKTFSTSIADIDKVAKLKKDEDAKEKE